MNSIIEAQQEQKFWVIQNACSKAKQLGFHYHYLHPLGVLHHFKELPYLQIEKAIKKYYE